MEKFVKTSIINNNEQYLYSPERNKEKLQMGQLKTLSLPKLFYLDGSEVKIFFF